MKFLKYLTMLLMVVSLFSCQQEKYLFYPKKLVDDYQFQFADKFDELNIQVDEDTYLNGLLFKADASKGLIYYLHGNAGALDGWGDVASLYVENGYDIFILDYRGFGKSGGAIESEKQLFKDIQIVYDTLKQQYAEDKITLIGYSIGSGLATYLASQNNPHQLILKAPYYSLLDLTKQYVKVVPSFMIKYKIRTDQFIENVKCPITVFHGDADEVIYYGSSLKLKEKFKEGDRLVTLKGQTHNGINDNPVYMKEITELLN